MWVCSCCLGSGTELVVEIWLSELSMSREELLDMPWFANMEMTTCYVS